MRTYRKIILGTMAFTFLFMVYYCAIVIFACTPIYKYWHRQIPGKCLPFPVVYISPAIITIIVDVVLFVLPIPLVLPLRMNRRRKIGLIMTFFLGFITTLCSVLRLRGTVHVPQTGDPQYLIRWAIAEANIGVCHAVPIRDAFLTPKTDRDNLSPDARATPQVLPLPRGSRHLLTQLPQPPHPRRSGREDPCLYQEACLCCHIHRQAHKCQH